jgi:flagellar FliL protein
MSETTEKPAAESPKADAKSTPAAGGAAPAKPKGGGLPVPLISIVVGAGIAGALLGSMVVGPQIVRTRVAAKPAAHEAAPAKGDGGTGGAEKSGKGEHGKPGEKHSVIRLENLIVNPQGSEGTRFLMTTVAIELEDAKLAPKIQDREDEIRDRIIAVLQRHTIESLAAPGARETIKREIAEVLVPITGDEHAVTIFLPQFVIQ